MGRWRKSATLATAWPMDAREIFKKFWCSYDAIKLLPARVKPRGWERVLFLSADG